jgi:hypothetical protein
MAEEPCCSYVPKGYVHPPVQPEIAGTASSASL